ncbi:MAG: rod shape-determining protein MreC [Chitinivibrionales bacterium]|nr:rod shape-determining protein MreC [Chitinivibrionales bacterium]
MLWIFQFIVRHHTFSSLIVTVLLSLWMLSMPPQQQKQMSRILTLSIFYPFQYTISLSGRVKNIFAENKRLRQKVATLTTRNAALEQYAEENERLKDLLSITMESPYSLQAAHVVVREPSHQMRSLIINAGHNKGVLRYMPVITQNGIVGKIIQVLPHLSQVQLIKDPSCKTSVMIKRSRAVGILETDEGDKFYVRLRNHEDVTENDTIITSGLGGIFPQGLHTGSVARVTEDANPLFKRVYIKPFVNFDRIEEVFVILLPPQWSAFQSEKDSLIAEE